MIALVNRREFEEVRRWGEALRRDEREDMRAAGEAIRLLCAEIERIGRELSAARAAMAAESSDSEPDEVDDTLSDEAACSKHRFGRGCSGAWLPCIADRRRRPQPPPRFKG